MSRQKLIFNFLIYIALGALFIFILFVAQNPVNIGLAILGLIIMIVGAKEIRDDWKSRKKSNYWVNCWNCGYESYSYNLPLDIEECRGRLALVAHCPNCNSIEMEFNLLKRQKMQ